jgi:ARG and Rhodanese-Phosphatase-superfamily-associated Protein domain
MAVYPFFAGTKGGSRYPSLDEAMGKNLLEIAKVSESGDIPNLKVKNKAEIAILILAGEELVGTKQNRIFNVTFSIGAGRRGMIPVSCVAQGPWPDRGKRFNSERRMCSPILRQEVHQDVMYFMRTGGGFRADHSRGWNEVAAKSARMKVRPHAGREYDLDQLYLINDLTEGVRDLIDKIPGLLKQQQKILGLPEPLDIKPIDHSRDPYECKYYNLCNKEVPEH